MQQLSETSLTMRTALEGGGEGFDALGEKAAAARGEVQRTEQAIRRLNAADALQNLRDMDRAYAVICLKSWNRVTGEHPPSCARSSTFPDGETSCPTPFWLMRSATALFMMHTRSSLTVKSPCGSARA